jgi:hypothetical protein
MSAAPVTAGKSFQDFTNAVKESVEAHARRKNYTQGGADDNNQLLQICTMLGIHEHHAIGEIIYKAVEYLKAPLSTKRVLLEKVAGWAFVLWREL